MKIKIAKQVIGTPIKTEKRLQSSIAQIQGKCKTLISKKEKK